MIARSSLVWLLLSSVAAAGPYLVQFQGSVTAIVDGAPDSFWVGERVAGAFVYDPAAPTAFTLHQRFALVEPGPGYGSPPAGWSTDYESFPTDDANDLLTQVWRGGTLLVATEGGFLSRDEALDILWIGASNSGSTVSFADSGAPVFFGGNSGHWLNKVLGEPAVRSSLSTISGPQATALQINFAPADPEFVVDAQGLPEATLGSLADPASFQPTGGGIQFGPPDYSFRTDATDVSFEIDSYTINAIPEPTSLILLISLTSAMRAACDSRRLA